MKGTPAPRKELKRLERCGSVEAGIIIALCRLLGFSRKWDCGENCPITVRLTKVVYFH